MDTAVCKKSPERRVFYRTCLEQGVRRVLCEQRFALSQWMILYTTLREVRCHRIVGI